MCEYEKSCLLVHQNNLKRYTEDVENIRFKLECDQPNFPSTGCTADDIGNGEYNISCTAHNEINGWNINLCVTAYYKASVCKNDKYYVKELNIEPDVSLVVNNKFNIMS